ncbi:MAG: aminopeptidase [Bacteroidaceae bacterium]|nr:aminopeptidase [Bacteroidaceae bacterium]
MKKIFIIALSALVCAGVSAQDEKKDAPKGYVFTTVDSLAITPVKDQANSGTCWSFSSIGFFESELLRLGKGEHDLAEMFVVHKTMEDRAKAAVRLHGDIEFAQGGSFYDVVYCWKNYGMVPQEVMPGIMYKSDRINHTELTAVAKAYVDALAKGSLKKLTDVWQKGFSGIYDAYIGECPEKFTYNGKEYTPKSYAESLGLNMDDYVSLTSYTHHPFYEQFVIEIQDNWRWGLSYNLPLDEFMEVMHNAIKTGYTFAWGADVSETGFLRSKPAICVIPTDEDKENKILREPGEEKVITQELRQEGYDNWETTDDHGMQIFGIAKDQNGKEYFMVKNSWNTTAGNNGIWYASDAYVAYKTMNILVHKDALPKDIRKKLGIK